MNDAREKEVKSKGHADPLYDDHLAKINMALDHHKSRMDGLETAYHRPATSATEYPQHAVSDEYKSAFRNYLRKGMEGGLKPCKPRHSRLATLRMADILLRKIVSDRINRRI